MSSGASIDLTDQEDRAYLMGLIDGLVEEVSGWAHRRTGIRQITTQIATYAANERQLLQAPDVDWPTRRCVYSQWSSLLANSLNDISTIARAYASMTELWEDASRQKAAESSETFWDIYEHGRRRQLERLLADVYGAEEVLLLNCGMSALSVAIEVASPTLGTTILTGVRSYFETTDLLENHLVSRGVKIVKMAGTAYTDEAIDPDIMLFETAVNASSQQDVPDAEQIAKLAPRAHIICDNTVAGPTKRWLMYDNVLRDRMLIVESMSKFLCRDAMGGIIYGPRHLVDKARAYARTTGQQLQEKAFNYLREGEIRHVIRRLALHGRNLQIFVKELERCSSRLQLGRTLSFDFLRGGNLDDAMGCLIFIALDADPSQLVALHRDLISTWQHHAKRFGAVVSIRAGYGWDETVARCYEGSLLNQKDAPCFIRISVGIESPNTALHLASALTQSIMETTL